MSQQSESVLNGVLINMARSFLQYVAEGWPWVDSRSQSIEQQAMALAARQRQDVADIANLLTERECFIDFGTFPTEYTDLQFLALDTLSDHLLHSQNTVCQSISTALGHLQGSDDAESVQLLNAVQTRQDELLTALKELQTQLREAGSPA